MRKMNKRKTGFTLIEIVLVISIIVILSTAAFVGAVQVVNRASKDAEDLEAHNGKNFEPNAWNTVKDLSVNIEDIKKDIELNEALQRLFKNKDFKHVILETYLKTYDFEGSFFWIL